MGVLETVLYLEVLPGKAAAGREHEEGEGPQPALWGSGVLTCGIPSEAHKRAVGSFLEE